MHKFQEFHIECNYANISYLYGTYKASERIWLLKMQKSKASVPNSYM